MWFLCTLLCVSRREFFLLHWTEIFDSILIKLKEKTLKSKAMESISRLIWVYLFRCFESPISVAQKKIDTVFKTLLPYLIRDVSNMDLDLDVYVRLVYFYLVKFPEYANENLLGQFIQPSKLPDLDFGAYNSNAGLEKSIVCLRSFLLLLADLEKSCAGERESFTNIKQSDLLIEIKISIPEPLFPEYSNNVVDLSFENLELFRTRETSISAEAALLNKEVSSFLYQRMGSALRATFQKINVHIGQVLISFQGAITQKISLKAHGAYGELSPRSSEAISNLGSMGFFVPGKLDLDPSKLGEKQYLLLRIIIQCIPRYYPLNMPPLDLIIMLSRLMLNPREKIRLAAQSALKRISKIEHYDTCGYSWFISKEESLAGAICRISSQEIFAMVFQDYGDLWLNHNLFTVNALLNFSSFYLEQLNIWLDDLRSRNHDKDDIPDPRSIELIVQSIETRGLMFLIQQIPALRSSAIDIFRIAIEFKRVLDHKRYKFEQKVEKKAFGKRNHTLNRLLSFHGGRASMILQEKKSKRIQKGKNGEKKRIFDILVDLGSHIVSMNFKNNTGTDQFGNLDILSQKEIEQRAALLNQPQPLLYVATSSENGEIELWYRSLPQVIRSCVEWGYPSIFQNCLTEVWGFLRSMFPIIIDLSADYRGQFTIRRDGKMVQAPDERRIGNASISNEVELNLILQWKINLMVVVSSKSYSNGTSDIGQDLKALHSQRRSSDAILVSPRSTITSDNTYSAIRKNSVNRRSVSDIDFPAQSIQNLLCQILPLISSVNSEIRQAVVSVAGSIILEDLPILLNELQPHLHVVTEDVKLKLESDGKNEARKSIGRRRDPTLTEVAHILSLITEFVSSEACRKNDALMQSMSEYISSMHLFFKIDQIQMDWDHQMTRIYFSIFIQRLYSKISDINLKANDSGFAQEFLMPFRLRISLFKLFEVWCGHGSNQEEFKVREKEMIRKIIDQIKDNSQRDKLIQAIDDQVKALNWASLNAMASLLRGPITNSMTGIDVDELISWINAVLESKEKKYYQIGKSAIVSLIAFNPANVSLCEAIINQCYSSSNSLDVAHEYFMALVMLVVEHETWQSMLIKLLCLALFQIGNDYQFIRKGAARLLIALDRKVFGFKIASELIDDVMNLYEDDKTVFRASAEFTEDQDNPSGGGEIMKEIQSTYETAAITSYLPVVYKYSQSMVSQRLANERPELTYEMISEVTFRIHQLKEEPMQIEAIQVRDMLMVLAPWLKNVELEGNFSLNDEGHPDKNQQSLTWVVLNNLFHFTISFGDKLITEIQNLWVSLVEREGSSDGENSRRILVIIEYLVLVVLQQKNYKPLKFLKTIAVYICRTNSCSYLFEVLTSCMIPPSTAIFSSDFIQHVCEEKFVAPSHTYYEKIDFSPEPRFKFNACELYTLMLVDVSIEVGLLSFRPHLPLVLHIICVNLDNMTPFMHEQCRQLLVNLIQALRPPDEDSRNQIGAILAILNMKEGIPV